MVKARIGAAGGFGRRALRVALVMLGMPPISGPAAAAAAAIPEDLAGVASNRAVTHRTESPAVGARGVGRRPVRVADTITMAAPVLDSAGDPFIFSPDRAHFVMLLERGDVATNERIFSLLLFSVPHLLDNTPARTLVTFRTSGNDDALSDVRWSDAHTLTFLGAKESTSVQAYALDVRSGRLTQLTQSATSVVNYSVSAAGERILYRAIVNDQATNRSADLHGFTVSDEHDLASLMVGHLAPGYLKFFSATGQFGPQETLVSNVLSGQAQPVRFPADVEDVDPQALRPTTGPVSPDGQFTIVKRLVHVRGRDQWPEAKRLHAYGLAYVPAFFIVNLETAKASLLLDGPAPATSSSFVWSPDSRRVLLINAYVPTEGKEADALDVDISTGQAAPLNLAMEQSSQSPAPVKRLCAHPMSWTKSDEIKVVVDEGCHGKKAIVTYRRVGDRWRRQETTDFLAVADGLRIHSTEGLNTPPDVEVISDRTGTRRLITDFNPQFRAMEWAHVSVVSWTDRDGTRWSGNLFMPPTMAPGERHPLVIQTHGFTRDKFLVNGFASGSGYAAQVLASNGVVVLQAGELQDSAGEYNSSAHLKRTIAGYEGAIDYLDHAGFIDRGRVGLQGHSATSIPVLYGIAHPRENYHLSAALRTGACDFGYLNYLTVDEAGRDLLTHLLGGAPFGETAEAFSRNALPWHLNEVATPLMTQVTDAREYEQYVQCVWEVHEALTSLSKPEELIVLPEGTHDLVKPWERIVSQQAAVDWFRFWLQGYERTEPTVDAQETVSSLVAQNRRWERLCDLQRSNYPGRPTFCVPSSKAALN